jgi:membrane protein insertase Oxa1/YidC/SpoIIIJ
LPLLWINRCSISPRIFFIGATFPAALALYWLFSGLHDLSAARYF